MKQFFFKGSSVILTLITSLFSISILVLPSSAHDLAEFFPPFWGDGSQLIDAHDGYGEPLNIIISGKSSSKVLTNEGILNWARSLGFTYECLHQHGGGYMSANLGDGHGWVNQTAEFRQDYNSVALGTCLETFIGGNHFRIFRQNGPDANTGALFLAASQEEDLGEHHTVSPDGYDLGRQVIFQCNKASGLTKKYSDVIVARATNETTKYGGVSYTAVSRDLTGLLPIGTEFINHGISIDGVVKLLTVTIQEEASH